MSDQVGTRPQTLEEAKALLHRTIFAKVVELLALRKRVPEEMKRRGWPHEDLDLVAVLTAAVVYSRLKAHQLLRRPPGADSLKGLWPADQMVTSAKQIVDTLELDDLLVAR